VKLTSTSRLRIVTLFITMVLTAGIGTFLVESSYRNQISDIDSAINSTINDARDADGQELSAALFHIDQNSLDFSLYLLSRDGSLTVVNTSTKKISTTLTLADARAATKAMQSGSRGSEFRFRSLKISGGDFLLVAAPSQSASKNLRSNLLLVLLITIVTTLASFSLLSVYIGRLKRRDDVDALNRMQSFLGDASHELRTPLTVIKGYVELLSSGHMNLPADRDRALSRVTGEISRMESLIHDLLLLAEIGESATRELEILNLSEVTHAHVQDFALLNPERKVHVEIGSEIKVEAVRDYLSRFIQNALNNVSRHTAVSAPVSISLKRNARMAILTIEDGGAGLPEGAYRENIKSLNRFNPSRSRENGGSGLGMSIMAAVVAKTNGEMRLRKSDLGGLAVVAEFPIYRG
jgi:two-component system, OmpR family, sensor kinase